MSWPTEDTKHAKTTSLPPPTFHCPHGFSYRALEISSLVCGSSLSALAQYRSANKPCNAVMARTGSLCSLNRRYSPLRFLTSSKENLAFEGWRQKECQSFSFEYETRAAIVCYLVRKLMNGHHFLSICLVPYQFLNDRMLIYVRTRLKRLKILAKRGVVVYLHHRLYNQSALIPPLPTSNTRDPPIWFSENADQSWPSLQPGHQSLLHFGLRRRNQLGAAQLRMTPHCQRLFHFTPR